MKFKGFTLIELLIVTAIITIIASLLLPVLNKTKQQTQEIQCLNNLKSMTIAWKEYSQDNSGNFPFNANESDFRTNTVDWVTGILSFSLNSSDNTNQNDLSCSLLGPYTVKQTKIYKCPSDIFYCYENNQELSRTRSISMNQFIGNQDYTWGYYTYMKESDVYNISPSMLFIFLDEQPYSINDGYFYFSPEDSWIDTPANYHNEGGCFSFYDGHVERHKWIKNYLWPTLTQPNGPVQRPAIPENYEDLDFQWVLQRSSKPQPIP